MIKQADGQEMGDFCDLPAPMRPGEELDLARLESFLLHHLPGMSGRLSAMQFPSGHSNLTYLVRFGSQEMVLRRPPFGSKVKSAHDMSREYRVLSKLHAVYAEAPKALLYSDDLSVLGAPFYLMDRIRGIILRRDPPLGLPFSADTARLLGESFIENLARLHSLDYARIGLADLGKPEGYLRRQIRGWIERYYGSQTDDFIEVGRISTWLKEHMPETHDAAVIHNDYKYDSLVLDPSDVTKIVGVLDWEMCTVGDPLTDLGTTLTYWVEPQDPDDLQRIRWGPTTYPGSLTRAQLAERYARITGRDISRLAFYLAFARFKVAVIVQQIYYRYHHGLTRDPRFANLPEKIKTLLHASLRCAETGEI
jgi:aminoglycoside phosphotransferase (APT) family kinase protein